MKKIDMVKKMGELKEKIIDLEKEIKRAKANAETWKFYYKQLERKLKELKKEQEDA